MNKRFLLSCILSALRNLCGLEISQSDSFIATDTLQTIMDQATARGGDPMEKVILIRNQLSAADKRISAAKTGRAACTGWW